MAEMLACIAFDWLQARVIIPPHVERGKNSPFLWEKQQFQTRHFKTIYVLKTDNNHRGKNKGEEVATLVCDPHSHILAENQGLLKINNKWLYRDDFYNWFVSFLKCNALIFQAWSRIDIAVDFLHFAKKLKPENFILNYISKKYVKSGKGKGRLAFENTNNGIKVQTLKFGSETSDVTYYLYNKTVELNQVKMKGWIVDNWIKNGWDNITDVWRLEFSLKSQTKCIADSETGETVFNMSDIDCLLKPNEIYNYHLQHYFNFYYKDKKIRRLDRLKPVLIFPERLQTKYVAIEMSEKKDATRADKIFAKKLMMLNQEMRGSDFEMAIHGNELLTTFLDDRSLTKWFTEKYPNKKLDDRQLMRGAKKKNIISHQPGQRKQTVLLLAKYKSMHTGNYKGNACSTYKDDKYLKK